MFLRKTLLVLLLSLIALYCYATNERITYRNILYSTVASEQIMPQQKYTIIIFDSNDDEWVLKINIDGKSSIDTITGVMSAFDENKTFSFVSGNYIYLGLYVYNRYGEKTLLFTPKNGVFEITENDIKKITKFLTKKL